MHRRVHSTKWHSDLCMSKIEFASCRWWDDMCLWWWIHCRWPKMWTYVTRQVTKVGVNIFSSSMVWGWQNSWEWNLWYRFVSKCWLCEMPNLSWLGMSKGWIKLSYACFATKILDNKILGFISENRLVSARALSQFFAAKATQQAMIYHALHPKPNRRNLVQCNSEASGTHCKVDFSLNLVLEPGMILAVELFEHETPGTARKRI